MQFSASEVKDLLKAWLVISIAFAVAQTRQGGLIPQLDASTLVLFSVIAALTVGLGFLLHELAHKFVAQRYGARASFHAFNQMLGFSLITSFLFGILFAAPGAVFINGRINKARYGRISAAGPLMNLLLGVLFLGLALASAEGTLFHTAALMGYQINIWLGLFNMLPFWILDGKKIWDWNRKAYGALAAALFALMLLPGFIAAF